MTDNRVAVYAPSPGADDVHSITIMTGGYPAEYGRKLGGVIEVVNSSPARQGFGGSLSASVGSFDTGSGEAIVEHGSEKDDDDLSRPARRPRTVTSIHRLKEISRTMVRPRADRCDSSAIFRHPAVLVSFFATPRLRFLVPNENIHKKPGSVRIAIASRTPRSFLFSESFPPAWSGTFEACCAMSQRSSGLIRSRHPLPPLRIGAFVSST